MPRSHYETHDNRGRPFLVDVDGKIVTVSKNMNTYKVIDGKFVDIPHPPKHLFTKAADEIFIGKKSPKGGYDGLKTAEAEGNSLLLRKGNAYLFIGHEIYEFLPMTGDRITEYYSDIGPNDVPYPYAIGKTHIYMMLDRVAVEKSFFDMKQDIYEQHYYDTRVRDCQHGFGDTAICKDKAAVKERLAEHKRKTRKLKLKMIAKLQR